MIEQQTLLLTPLLGRLVEELQKFPGIGPKSAQRMAFQLLKWETGELNAFTDALLRAKAEIHPCEACFYLTDKALCEICTHPNRNRHLLAVVPEVQDVLALEMTHQFNGLYHVLGGLISPLDGIGPEQLTIAALLTRLERNLPECQEIILALPPSVEGDTTSLYLTGQLKTISKQVSRIAFGLPVGGELEYADSLTLSRALTGRTLL